MSAPKPLPPCPCGEDPIEMILGSPGYAANVTIEHRVYKDHLVQVAARTRRQARSKWRRFVGGAR